MSSLFSMMSMWFREPIKRIAVPVVCWWRRSRESSSKQQQKHSRGSFTPPRSKNQASIVFWSCQIRWIIHSTTSRFSREQETAHIRILFFIELLESLLKKKKKRRWWWWRCEREGGKITLEQQQRKYIYFIVSLSLAASKNDDFIYSQLTTARKVVLLRGEEKSAKKATPFSQSFVASLQDEKCLIIPKS